MRCCFSKHDPPSMLLFLDLRPTRPFCQKFQLQAQKKLTQEQKRAITGGDLPDGGFSESSGNQHDCPDLLGDRVGGRRGKSVRPAVSNAGSRRKDCREQSCSSDRLPQSAMSDKSPTPRPKQAWKELLPPSWPSRCITGSAAA